MKELNIYLNEGILGEGILGEGILGEGILGEGILDEGILGDLDDIVKKSDKVIKDSIMDFLYKNYSYRPTGSRIMIHKPSTGFNISNEPNVDGKYIVDYDGDVLFTNTRIKQLTNDYFVWGKVNGYFSCSYCKSLTSLEGAPREVEEYFDCSHCKSLKSLEGAPERVGEYNTPGDFYCISCGKKFTKDDVMDVCDVQNVIV